MSLAPVKRLHWGSGPQVADGWVNSDRDDYGQQHLGDIRDGLPWDSGFFAYAVSHHALQMIAYTDVVAVLAELRRVLAPRGWLRLGVPDCVAAFRAWQAGRSSHFSVADEVEPHIDGKLCAYLSWYSTAQIHFTGPWLVDLCGRAGFGRVEEVQVGRTITGIDEITELDGRAWESAFVEAQA